MPDDRPIDMILRCPACGRRHIDAPEPGTDWTNPPHRSHKCHGCGTVWRPADVPTNGVASVKTRGKADSWLPAVLKDTQAPADGVAIIAAERLRQVEKEGWTPEHDKGHHDGTLARAAACYATPPAHRVLCSGVPRGWPWMNSWWKPGDRIRELAKAGALIAAEIDRLQRATAVPTPSQEGPPPINTTPTASGFPLTPERPAPQEGLKASARPWAEIRAEHSKLSEEERATIDKAAAAEARILAIPLIEDHPFTPHAHWRKDVCEAKFVEGERSRVCARTRKEHAR